MIKLRKLRFGNMFSWGDNNEVCLDENSITQLTAPNGSGKTSIVLILQELLFSNNVKKFKKNDILNRYSGAKKWWGEVEFDSNTDEYIVRVERAGATSKVKLLKNGTDISDHKIPDTYKKIQNILGLDFTIFSQLTYQHPVDLNLEFLMATDANRKKFLINLFNLEKYVEIGENLKIKISEEERQLNRLEGELSSTNDFLANVVIPSALEPKILPEVDQELQRRIGVLDEQLKNFKAEAAKIDRNNLHRVEREALVFDMDMVEPTAPAQVEKDRTECVSEIRVIESQISSDTAKMKGLNLSDKCYACGQDIDNSVQRSMKFRLESQINDYHAKLEDLRLFVKNCDVILSEFKTAKQKYDDNKKKIEKFEQLSQLIDFSLPTEVPNYASLEATRKTYLNEFNKQCQEQNDAIVYNEQVKIRATKIETLTDQRREFLARQELLNGDIINSKLRLKHLNVLRKAFSTAGIVAFKLENLTKELEDTINNYLAEMSDGQFQVVFRLDGEKLNIIIINQGKECPIETLSGGEFGRVQTAILLAVRKVLSKLGNNYINLLFLDEITGVLDDAGKEKLIDVLREEEGLNVFLVSHDFTHPLINKISINKNNNQSYIE